MLRTIVALFAIATLGCSSGPTDPFPKNTLECLPEDLMRRSIFWPTLTGTAQCPLPADHPKCVAGVEQFCRSASRSER